MRALTLSVLFLAAMLMARGALAQTWSHQYTFTSNPYAAAENTCAYPPQPLLIEGGAYYVYAPAVIYAVYNLYLPPPYQTIFHTRHVTLFPQYGAEDFSLWVCHYHNGNSATDCIDGSDNGPAQSNSVTVPAQSGAWYVIVTGNIDNAYPMCGPYWLQEYY